MQFTTLFSIVASAALARAQAQNVTQNVASGEKLGSSDAPDVVVFNAYHEATDSCPTADATTTYGGVAGDVNTCKKFDQSYASVELLGKEQGYNVHFYLTDDCSETDGALLTPDFEVCNVGNDGDTNEPFLSWEVVAA